MRSWPWPIVCPSYKLTTWLLWSSRVQISHTRTCCSPKPSSMYSAIKCTLQPYFLHQEFNILLLLYLYSIGVHTKVHCIGGGGNFGLRNYFDRCRRMSNELSAAVDNKSWWEGANLMQFSNWLIQSWPVGQKLIYGSGVQTMQVPKIQGWGSYFWKRT